MGISGKQPDMNLSPPAGAYPAQPRGTLNLRRENQMLLNSEVKAGEIYVIDFDFNIGGNNNREPELFQMVQEPRTVQKQSLLSFGTTEETINPLFENIITGELKDYGIHCFSTVERIKKQFQNIGNIQKSERVEYVQKAYKLISDYEAVTASA
jgi:uncharacterized protein YheU (UPF0270 family)